MSDHTEQLELVEEEEEDNNGKDRRQKQKNRKKRSRSRQQTSTPTCRKYCLIKMGREKRMRRGPGCLMRSCAARLGRFCMAEGRLCLLSALAAIPPFFLLLWLSGLMDFFHELPFEQFSWPPGTEVDVRKQVILELLEQPTEVPPLQQWAQFEQPLFRPSCKLLNRLNRKRSILIVVKSAPERLERRQAVRATFGSSTAENFTDGYRLVTAFAMGRPPPGKEEAEQLHQLAQEAAMHGDLLVGQFHDDYLNNTLKFVHSMGLAVRHPPQCGGQGQGQLKKPLASFVLLLDDDYLLLPWTLALEVAKHVPNERLYMGWRYDSSPFRMVLRKYRVSLEEFPFSAYPPYITAGAVLLSSQTVREFHAAIQHTKLFKFDDIYAGILAHILGILPQQNANFPDYPHWKLDHGTGTEWWRTLVAAHGYSPGALRQVYDEAVQKWTDRRR